MKLAAFLVLFLIMVGVLFGYVLPFLFSQPSDSAVVTGFAIISLMVWGLVSVVSKIFERKIKK